MTFKVLQHDAEIEAFAALLRREGVTRYLEIGSKFGGSLWRIAKHMAPGVVVSVDMPGSGESKVELIKIMRDLALRGHETHIVWGDSTSDLAIEEVRRLGPYDAVFIDGDHRLAGVTADWRNYAPMARIVAFHDISWERPEDWAGGLRIDVPVLWNEIKAGYRHEEFRLDPKGGNNGIGVLWREEPVAAEPADEPAEEAEPVEPSVEPKPDDRSSKPRAPAPGRRGSRRKAAAK